MTVLKPEVLYGVQTEMRPSASGELAELVDANTEQFRRAGRANLNTSQSGSAAPMGEDRARMTGADDMSKRPRRNHSAAFKAKVAIEALTDGKTIAEVALKHDVHPNQVTEWRRQLIERAAGVFGGTTAPETPPVDLKMLHAKIGQLTLENDFLEGALSKAGDTGALPWARRS